MGVLSGLGIENIDWSTGLAQIGGWFIFILEVLSIFAVLGVVYYVTTFKYKVTIFKIGGSGLKGSNEEKKFSIGRIFKDRAREFKDKKTKTVYWRLLKSRKKINPIEYQYIYPGNKVFLYQTAPDSFHPFELTVTSDNASFEPVPQLIKQWEQQEIRQSAEDYNKKSAWDKYGQTIVMAGTILFCLILTGVTVYFSYKHANGIVGALSGMTDTLKNINTIPSFK